VTAKNSIEERLRVLREIRDGGDLDKIRDTTRKNLNDKCNLITGEAVKLIGDFELSGFEAELLSLWESLLAHKDPIKADKGCTAKAAIIETLSRLGYDDAEFYLAALKYQQIEPAWPRAEDTAENVRAGSAFALARSRSLRIVDKLNAFVDYMQGTRADRINAARAITDTRHEMAIPLLRLKLLSGDTYAETMGVCMTGLLDLAPDASIPLVADFLTNPTENVVLEAAAALGMCGRPKAVEALIGCWKETGDEEIQRSLLLSIGLSRDPTAISFLISQLGSNQNTEDVLEALKPSCIYEETQNRVRETLRRLGDRMLLADFERKFGKGS
jgi:HEAT repeat protein